LKPKDSTVARTLLLDLPPQVVHGQVAGVDHEVGHRVEVVQELPLGGDPVDEPAAALQRVGPADALEAADQHRVGGLQEQHPRTVPTLVQVADHAAQVGGEGPAAHVDDDRDAGHLAGRPAAQVDHRRDQRRRQVVHHVVAQVLQALGRGAAAGPGQPGHHDHLEPRRLRHRAPPR
jgi:hypothetical protein